MAVLSDWPNILFPLEIKIGLWRSSLLFIVDELHRGGPPTDGATPSRFKISLEMGISKIKV